jgi:DNA-binding MarR family transcriptional regulator|tara:strand:+ start:729 stop:1070 length:342 start_codon:yes stop_codon:yes gene_type:complete
MKLTQSEALKGLALTFDSFGELSDTLTLQQLKTFLLVARRGRVTGQDVIKELGISKANASRTLAILSDDVMVRRKSETMALITYEIDVYDKRYRYAVLTKKGQDLANSITSNF